MSYTAIDVQNLSKQYRLGVIGTGTLSHDLNRWWHLLRGREDPYLKVGDTNDQGRRGGKYVWALRDINFKVQQGEVVGIIGSNGAGKSTLLKILSQVTAPTTGRFRARGRIASLLEVGTGFHKELTGRENIFLNGAILGMTRAEIRSKLDEIIEFSGVARYVDTPVKRYSSGMKVRLAFAVAAHLEPEILIVDEVLAVGDAAFQQKAIGKMQEVSRGAGPDGAGRTVLFVSHNMGAVKRLCTRGIVLKQGSIHYDGPTEEAIHQYALLNAAYSQLPVAEQTNREGLGDYRFTMAWIENEHGLPTNEIRTGSSASFHLTASPQTASGPKLVYAAICFRDALGSRLFSLSTSFFGKQLRLEGETRLRFELPRMPLSEGEYLCDLYMAEGRGDTLIQDFVHRALRIKVFGNDYYNSGDPQPVGLDKFYTDFRLIQDEQTIIMDA